ncbi:MAG: type II secretion system protein [Methylococcaceae bacterium]|nr:type II secretion system protein [Methylococcaceae bacterium]
MAAKLMSLRVMSCNLMPRRQTGMTLIELIMALVVIAVALTGALKVINLTASHSADPLVQQQAIYVAQAYLEEILLQNYTDPDGTNAGETRASFDNVGDYDGLNNTGARDQYDNLITNLSAYHVSVTVVDQPISGLNAKKISVTAKGPNLPGLTLVGYKFNY